jgi:broad specificity phosphatase PhoE
MGEWERRTLAALHREVPELVGHVFGDPASFQYPGGESFAAFVDRVQAAMDQFLRTHQTGDVALVAHGGVCRTIIGSLLGMPMRKWLCLSQAYACLNVIDWYDGNPILLLLNYQNSLSRL